MPLVSAEGLCQGYGRIQVLHDLDLQIDAGVMGLLGPNGAGKSTLLDTLSTLRRPRGGHLSVLGHDAAGRLSRRAIRRGVGFLPQGFGYPPRFTAREFVSYAAWLREAPGDVGELARTALEAVGLRERAGDRLKTLSGGMMRRVGIATAIVGCPSLTILDEPTGGLDPEQRVGVREIVRQLGADGGVVLSTHLVEDIAATCSRVCVLDEGRIVYDGAVDELAEAAAPGVVGDTALERGYMSVLTSSGR